MNLAGKVRGRACGRIQINPCGRMKVLFPQRGGGGLWWDGVGVWLGGGMGFEVWGSD